MALSFVDSVAHYAVTDIAEKCWTPEVHTLASVVVDPTAGPASRPMLKGTTTLNGAEFCYRRAGSGTDTCFLGARYQIGNLSVSPVGVPVMSYISNGWLCVMIGVTPSGAVAAYRAAWNASSGHNGFRWFGVVAGMATLLGTSATTPIVVNNAYYIESKCVLADTNGSVKVWVNGELVLDLSGIQTTVYHIVGAGGGCSGLIDTVAFGSVMVAGTPHYVGEFYVGDAEEGDLRIDAHLPDANGSDRDWALSTGSDEYALLDEDEANITDYTETETVGDRVSVSLEPLWNVGGVIVTVQQVGYLTKQNAGPCVITPYVKIGGTRYPASTSWYPTWGGWQFYRYLWHTNPATGLAWLESEFNAAEFGVERTA